MSPSTAGLGRASRVGVSATLRALDGEEAERAAARRDAEAPGPGWPCYGGSGVAGARLVAGWSWLTPVVRMPEGTGIRLAAGRPLVLGSWTS